MTRSINRARRYQRRLLARIARTAALPASPEREERLALERYRYSRSGGVKAVHLRKMKRLRHKDDAAISRMANRMNLLTICTRPIPWWFKPKSEGFRRLCDPPTKIRLGQLIARDLTLAQITPDTSLYDWPGRGIHLYVGDISDALQKVGPYAFSLDIRDCYEHVNIAAIYDLEVLPPELIRSSIDPRFLRFRRSHRLSDVLPYRVADSNSADPCGLMQGGSASSALVVALLGSVSGSLPANAWVGGIADDFLAIGVDDQNAAVAGGRLTRYLTECPLGPSEFKTKMLDARDGFQHVGCLFMQIGGTIETWIPEGKLNALIDKMTTRIKNPPPDDEHRDVDHYVRKALGPYPWATDWQRQHVAECAEKAWESRVPRPGPG